MNPLRLHALVASIALCGVACLTSNAQAAGYIRLDGVDGDVGELPGTAPPGCGPSQRCWIALEAWFLPLPSADGSSGMAAARFAAQASPALAALLGSHVGKGTPLAATIRFTNAGGTQADDVVVDGRIITAENHDTALGLFRFTYGQQSQMLVQHHESQRDGSFATTASGGWGIQGKPGFQGHAGVFDALRGMGATVRSDGSWLLASPVPEPGSFALLAAGLAAISFSARWRGRRAAAPSALA